MHCLVLGSERLVISLHQEAGICPLSALFSCLERIKSRQVYLNRISSFLSKVIILGLQWNSPIVWLV